MNLDRVLYVDDDVDGCELMTFWLRNGRDYEVTTVTQAEAALSLIEKHRFDVYLLDFCLPETTGVAMCRKIREAAPNAPIIIYSALSRDIDRQEALAAGANAYLVKPNNLDEVRSEIRKHLDSSRAAIRAPKIRHRAASIL